MSNSSKPILPFVEIGRLSVIPFDGYKPFGNTGGSVPVGLREVT
jgi:hypothetical protein